MSFGPRAVPQLPLIFLAASPKSDLDTQSMTGSLELIIASIAKSYRNTSTN
jgi:hypothetical protein